MPVSPALTVLDDQLLRLGMIKRLRSCSLELLSSDACGQLQPPNDSTLSIGENTVLRQPWKGKELCQLLECHARMPSNPHPKHPARLGRFAFSLINLQKKMRDSPLSFWNC